MCIYILHVYQKGKEVVFENHQFSGVTKMFKKKGKNTPPPHQRKRKVSKDLLESSSFINHQIIKSNHPFSGATFLGGGTWYFIYTVYIWYVPLPVTATFWIITCLGSGIPNLTFTNSTVTGRGPYPRYIGITIESLKNDGWKMSFLLGPCRPFLGAMSVKGCPPWHSSGLPNFHLLA